MKKANNDKGVIMFAHNNSEIDYFRLAVVNALLVQKNLGIKNVTVVTDPFSLAHGEKTLGKRLIKKAINNIIVVDKDKEFKRKNQRLYKDTSHTAKRLQFYNANRCDAYELSPYKETLLIDVDYLILSDTLNHCWGHNNELMMNWRYQDIMFERKDPTLSRLNPLGITMYWATVVYFKNALAEASITPVIKDESESARLAGFGQTSPMLQRVFVHEDEYDNAKAILKDLSA